MTRTVTSMGATYQIIVAFLFAGPMVVIDTGGTWVNAYHMMARKTSTTFILAFKLGEIFSTQHFHLVTTSCQFACYSSETFNFFIGGVLSYPTYRICKCVTTSQKHIAHWNDTSPAIFRASFCAVMSTKTRFATGLLTRLGMTEFGVALKLTKVFALEFLATRLHAATFRGKSSEI